MNMPAKLIVVPRYQVQSPHQEPGQTPVYAPDYSGCPAVLVSGERPGSILESDISFFYITVQECFPSREFKT
jgi:hypothetical protein